MYSFARHGGRRPADARCCSPATATSSRRWASASAILELRKDGRPQSRSGRSRCASATASTRSRCPTSSRCAATPPTACRARRASARRRQPSCCGATARWRARCARRGAPPRERPRIVGGADRERGAAAHDFRRDRHARADRRATPAGPRHGLRRRRGHSARAWHEPVGGAVGGDDFGVSSDGTRTTARPDDPPSTRLRTSLNIDGATMRACRSFGKPFSGRREDFFVVGPACEAGEVAVELVHEDQDTLVQRPPVGRRVGVTKDVA